MGSFSLTMEVCMHSGRLKGPCPGILPLCARNLRCESARWCHSDSVINLTGRGILSVQAQGQDSEFLFATMHLESPIDAKSPLRPFFEESRKVQAQQVGLTNPLVDGQMHHEACCGSAVQASGRRRLVDTCTCNAWFWTCF